MLTARPPTLGWSAPLPPTAGAVPPGWLPPDWLPPDWLPPDWLPPDWLPPDWAPPDSLPLGSFPLGSFPLGWPPPGWTAVTGPEDAGPLGVICTPGRAEATWPPCGWAWQSPAVHWLPGMGALKCSTVRDMLAARNAATTTPRPAANVGVTTSRRSAGLIRLPRDERARRGRASSRPVSMSSGARRPRPARARVRAPRARPRAAADGARCRGRSLRPGDRI